jgi:hypothetical protein
MREQQRHLHAVPIDVVRNGFEYTWRTYEFFPLSRRASARSGDTSQFCHSSWQN